jgi:hypothetical protein
MKYYLIAIAFAGLLAGCGGGVGQAQFKSPGDVHAICLRQSESLVNIYGRRSDDGARRRFGDAIKNQCCGALARASSDLDHNQRTYLWYAFARELDDQFDDRTIDQYNQAFSDIQAEMSRADFGGPERARAAFMQCVGEAGRDARLGGW